MTDISNAPAEDFDSSAPRDPRYRAYGPAPIPDPRDEPVRRFVEAALEGGPAAVELAVATATDPGRNVLRAFGERSASVAVRTGDRHELLLGAGAIVIGGLALGGHEAMMSMSLIDDAAIRLGIDLPELFEELSPRVGNQAVVALVRWLTRKPEERTPAIMGFAASEDSGGFRYVWSG